MSFYLKRALGIMVLLMSPAAYADSESDTPHEQERPSNSKIIQMFPSLVEIAKKIVPQRMRYKNDSAPAESPQLGEGPSNAGSFSVSKKNSAGLLIVLALIYSVIRLKKARVRSHIKMSHDASISQSPDALRENPFQKKEENKKFKKDRDKRNRENPNSSKKSKPSGSTSPNLEDSFAILGLNSNASVLEITRAFRRLIVKNHPDKFSNCSPKIIKQAEIITKKIILAKENCLKFKKK
jgi:hypothetical protein